MKVTVTKEIPNVFEGAKAIDSLPDLSDFYGYAMEADNDGDTSVLILIPTCSLADLSIGEAEEDE